MVLLTYKPFNKQFSLDGYLNSNLDRLLKKAIPNKWDIFGILFGREGSGKTTLATQICYKLDPNFSVKNIVWTAEQFDKAIDEAKDESAILWDEAITGAKASQHADSISQKIVSKLTMIRKKKLKIIICFPYLYMIQKYFVSRCLFSIYCYAKGFGDRGYAKAYNSRKTEKLYNLMKEKYRYDYLGAFREAKYSFYFRFTSMFCADENEYDRLKTESSRLENEKVTDKYLIEHYFDLCFIRDNKLLGKYAKTRGYTSGNVYTNFLRSYNHIKQTHKHDNILAEKNEDINNENDNVNIKKVYKEKSKVNKEVDYKEDDDGYDEMYNNGIIIPDEHLDIIGKRLKDDKRWMNPTE